MSGCPPRSRYKVAGPAGAGPLWLFAGCAENPACSPGRV